MDDLDDLQGTPELIRDDGENASAAAGGVLFPIVDGRRSTTATGRAVIADAVRQADPELAAQILAEKDWRSHYLDPFRRLTALAVTGAGAPGAISTDGLASVHRRFVFRTGDRDLPLAEAMAAGLDAGAGRAPALHRAVVAGGLPMTDQQLAVPYQGTVLTGPDLDRRLDGWVRAGTTEESFAQAVRAVVANPQWLDLRDLTVVVLGAGAEMGPLEPLVRWGAHVVAVDLPRYDTWRRLIELVRGSRGRMTVPVNRWLPSSAPDDEIAAAAGADLLTRTPELLAWLATVEGPFTLGNYVYAEGAQHVRATVAVDALTVALTRLRDDVSLAFLATPTDVFAVPQDAVDDAERRYHERTLLRRMGRLGSGGRLLRRNYTELLTMPDGRQVGLNDSLVPQQGPNYALAKRIQRWRAVHERVNGRLVSLNVAPATRTRSVLRTRTLAAAYAGAHRFGIEMFEPTTSNVLMAALLVHDLRNPAALANPATPLGHPVELLWQGANHGGLWRNAYAPRSVLGLAVVLGMVRRDS